MPSRGAGGADGGPALAAGLGEAATRVLGLGTAAFLLAMMLITTVDVFGRYLFAAPLPGAFEITQILLAATIFAGLPIVTLRDEHVTVTLFSERLEGVAARWHAVFVSLLGAVVLAIVAWRLAEQAARLAAYGDTTSLLRLPLSPLAWGMAGLTAAASLAAAALAVGHLSTARAGVPPQQAS